MSIFTEDEGHEIGIFDGVCDVMGLTPCENWDDDRPLSPSESRFTDTDRRRHRPSRSASLSSAESRPSLLSSSTSQSDSMSVDHIHTIGCSIPALRSSAANIRKGFVQPTVGCSMPSTQDIVGPLATCAKRCDNTKKFRVDQLRRQRIRELEQMNLTLKTRVLELEKDTSSGKQSRTVPVSSSEESSNPEGQLKLKSRGSALLEASPGPISHIVITKEAWSLTEQAKSSTGRANQVQKGVSTSKGDDLLQEMEDLKKIVERQRYVKQELDSLRVRYRESQTKTRTLEAERELLSASLKSLESKHRTLQRKLEITESRHRQEAKLSDLIDRDNVTKAIILDLKHELHNLKCEIAVERIVKRRYKHELEASHGNRDLQTRENQPILHTEEMRVEVLRKEQHRLRQEHVAVARRFQTNVNSVAHHYWNEEATLRDEIEALERQLVTITQGSPDGASVLRNLSAFEKTIASNKDLKNLLSDSGNSQVEDVAESEDELSMGPVFRQKTSPGATSESSVVKSEETASVANDSVPGGTGRLLGACSSAEDSAALLKERAARKLFNGSPTEEFVVCSSSGGDETNRVGATSTNTIDKAPLCGMDELKPLSGDETNEIGGNKRSTGSTQYTPESQACTVQDESMIGKCHSLDPEPETNEPSNQSNNDTSSPFDEDSVENIDIAKAASPPNLNERDLSTPNAVVMGNSEVPLDSKDRKLEHSKTSYSVCAVIEMENVLATQQEEKSSLDLSKPRLDNDAPACFKPEIDSCEAEAPVPSDAGEAKEYFDDVEEVWANGSSHSSQMDLPCVREFREHVGSDAGSEISATSHLERKPRRSTPPRKNSLPVAECHAAMRVLSTAANALLCSPGVESDHVQTMSDDETPRVPSIEEQRAGEKSGSDYGILETDVRDGCDDFISIEDNPAPKQASTHRSDSISDPEFSEKDELCGKEGTVLPRRVFLGQLDVEASSYDGQETIEKNDMIAEDNTKDETAIEASSAGASSLGDIDVDPRDILSCDRGDTSIAEPSETGNSEHPHTLIAPKSDGTRHGDSASSKSWTEGAKRMLYGAQGCEGRWNENQPASTFQQTTSCDEALSDIQTMEQVTLDHHCHGEKGPTATIQQVLDGIDFTRQCEIKDSQIDSNTEDHRSPLPAYSLEKYSLNAGGQSDGNNVLNVATLRATFDQSTSDDAAEDIPVVNYGHVSMETDQQESRKENESCLGEQNDPNGIPNHVCQYDHLSMADMQFERDDVVNEFDRKTFDKAAAEMFPVVADGKMETLSNGNDLIPNSAVKLEDDITSTATQEKIRLSGVKLVGEPGNTLRAEPQDIEYFEAQRGASVTASATTKTALEFDRNTLDDVAAEMFPLVADGKVATLSNGNGLTPNVAAKLEDNTTPIERREEIMMSWSNTVGDPGSTLKEEPQDIRDFEVQRGASTALEPTETSFSNQKDIKMRSSSIGWTKVGFVSSDTRGNEDFATREPSGETNANEATGLQDETACNNQGTTESLDASSRTPRNYRSDTPPASDNLRKPTNNELPIDRNDHQYDEDVMKTVKTGEPAFVNGFEGVFDVAAASNVFDVAAASNTAENDMQTTGSVNGRRRLGTDFAEYAASSSCPEQTLKKHSSERDLTRLEESSDAVVSQPACFEPELITTRVLTNDFGQQHRPPPSSAQKGLRSFADNDCEVNQTDSSDIFAGFPNYRDGLSPTVLEGVDHQVRQRPSSFLKSTNDDPLDFFSAPIHMLREKESKNFDIVKDELNERTSDDLDQNTGPQDCSDNMDEFFSYNSGMISNPLQMASESAAYYTRDCGQHIAMDEPDETSNSGRGTRVSAQQSDDPTLHHNHSNTDGNNALNENPMPSLEETTIGENPSNDEAPYCGEVAEGVQAANNDVCDKRSAESDVESSTWYSNDGGESVESSYKEALYFDSMNVLEKHEQGSNKQNDGNEDADSQMNSIDNASLESLRQAPDTPVPFEDKNWLGNVVKGIASIWL